MDLTPDPGIGRNNVLSASIVRDGADAAPLDWPGLDWPGLAARLAAAHAARQVLAPLPRVRARVPGSFAPAVARQITLILHDAHGRTDGIHHAALTQSLKPIASHHDR